MTSSDGTPPRTAITHQLRDWLEGECACPLGRAARVMLRPLGWAYGAGMSLRGALYARGVFGRAQVSVPVISIGNLTAGGTGKTPFSLYLSEWLLRAGMRPALLIRGYGSDSPDEADEVQLLRERLPDVPVLAGRDRVASADRAIADGADVLLLDDGFQHLRLKRDLDIVLLDARRPWGGGQVLPAGLLREPTTALRRADLLCLTHIDRVDDPEAVRANIRKRHPDTPLLCARHAAARLRAPRGQMSALTELRGRPVVAFCGIARPEGFLHTLTELGAQVVASQAFADHHVYGPSDLEALLRLAETKGADLVTTEKDAVKLRSDCGANLSARLWVVGVDLWIEDDAPLREALVRVIGERARSGGRPD